MEININIHHHYHDSDTAKALEKLSGAVSKILKNTKTVMATQAELVEKVNAVTAKVAKIGTETSTLLQKVEELQAVIDAEGNASPELEAAVAALTDQAAIVDDLVADAAPTPPTEPAEPEAPTEEPA